MPVKATVNSSSSYTVQVKPTKSVVSSIVARATTESISLGSLTNVDTSNADDGETLVFNAGTGKYVVQQLTDSGLNIASINGGSF